MQKTEIKQVSYHVTSVWDAKQKVLWELMTRRPRLEGFLEEVSLELGPEERVGFRQPQMARAVEAENSDGASSTKNSASHE